MPLYAWEALFACSELRPVTSPFLGACSTKHTAHAVAGSVFGASLRRAFFFNSVRSVACLRARPAAESGFFVFGIGLALALALTFFFFFGAAFFTPGLAAVFLVIVFLGVLVLVVVLPVWALGRPAGFAAVA